MIKIVLSLTLVATLYSNVDAAPRNFTLDQSVQLLAKANQEFTLNLYKQLVKPRENLVVSGFSASTVLTVLLEGSKGQSARELSAALHLDKLSVFRLEDGFRKVLGAIRGNDEYTLSTANSIWIKEGYGVLERFQNRVRDVYLSELKVLRPGEGKRDINQYVAEKTEDLIQDFLKDEPSVDTVAFLLNAVFFNGTWKSPFQSYTFEAGFLDNDDEIPQDDFSSATTRMMKIKKAVFRYVNSEDLKTEILELPYNGGETSFLVLLPYGTTLVELEETITAEKLQKAIGQLRPANVSLVMPKFKIESELDLAEPLVRLGVKDVFTDRADLSGIGNGLKVSDVLQKAVIEVSQDGTKAAAATGISIETTSLEIPPANLKEIRVTHPFMFLLRHEPTNNILFAGRYSKSTPFNPNES